MTIQDSDRTQISELIFQEKKEETPVEWAEANRIMTSDVSNFKGRFMYDRNPYMKEIVNRLLPEDPAREVVIMKGAQIGVSTCILENGIGWIIRHNPANTLLASADEDLIKEQFETKIDNMIQQSGLREYIRPNVIKRRNNRTGDTNRSKEFAGGRLYGRSVQNARKWRQTSFKYGFVDDFEAAEREDKREGSITDLIRQRFASYGTTHKIFWISTPALKATSNIEPLYQAGDQRRYHMPCPCCGAYITLEFQILKDGIYHGIVWEVDDNDRLIEGSVRYKCQECGGEFPEAGNKADMLEKGEWIATKEPDEPGLVSYHISALYAAPGMFNWDHYVRQFISAQKSPAKLKTFKNVVLGETWEEQGSSPKATKISKNTRPYDIGVVPNLLSQKDGNGQIVLLTCACDLNGLLQGFNSQYCDARLDYEVLAHSESGATYSIDAGSIGTFQRGLKGNTEGRDLWSLKHGQKNSVWPEFEKVLAKQYVSDEGKPFKILVSGVDTGSFTQFAYKFLDTTSHFVYGLKGDQDYEIMRLNVDQITFRPTRERNDLYLVKGNKIKDDIASYMRLDWEPGVEQPPGFMNFPIPSQGKYTVKGYFIEFEGEQKYVELNKSGDAIGYSWRKKTGTSRNHFFDCNVYNRAVRDILVHNVLTEVKVKYPTWAQFVELLLNN